MRLLLMGPPGCSERPILTGRGDTQALAADRPEQTHAAAIWSDGSRGFAMTGALRVWGPVVHVIEKVPGQPFPESLIHTFTQPPMRATEHGLLQAGHFPRLGLTVFQLDDGPLRDPAFTSVLVMAGPHDVTVEPTWYWAEEDSQPSAASHFAYRDNE